jgi:transglutaminase-like putative cysteine protease
MKIRVSHLTRYEYDRPVQFSPHYLYLRPREDPLLHVESFSLGSTPAAKTYWMRDDCDNLLACAHFSAPAQNLEILSEFEVLTSDTQPLDYKAKQYATTFPFEYEQLHRFNLGSYLVKPATHIQSTLQQWLNQRFPTRPRDTGTYLFELNKILQRSLRNQSRSAPGIQSSIQTITLGSGACRDFAVLLVDLLRILGLAARFVSGYFYDPAVAGTNDTAMHAWTEVYLPGAGWKGLDPTTGLFCYEAYIPVAHAAIAESVNPIQGSYIPGQPTPAVAHAPRLFTNIITQRLA